MHELTPRIIAILARYTRVPAAVISSAMTFRELEIDRLDLPMIVLDIEDACNVHIRYDDEIEAIASVGDLVACTATRISAHASQLQQRAAAPRVRRSWVSTEAEQRP